MGIREKVSEGFTGLLLRNLIQVTILGKPYEYIYSNPVKGGRVQGSEFGAQGLRIGLDLPNTHQKINLKMKAHHEYKQEG